LFIYLDFYSDTIYFQNREMPLALIWQSSFIWSRQ